MPFQEVPLTAFVRIFWQQDGNTQAFENGLFFERSAGWDAATLASLVAGWVGELQSGLEAFYDANLKVHQVTARDLDSEFGPTAASALIDNPGTKVATNSPPNNASVIKFFPTVPPPRSGRIFWPYLAEEDTTETGNVDATWRTDLAAQFNTSVNSAIAGLSAQHVLVSRFLNGNPRSQGLTVPVDDISVLLRVGSQRDRRTKGLV